MNIKHLSRIILLLVGVSICVSIFSAGFIEAAERPNRLSALCGPVGGSGFSFMSVWAPVINSTLNLNISVQSRGGNAMTARLVDAGEGNFGLSTAGLCYQGRQGTAEWANNKKLTDMRTIIVFQPYVFQAYGLAKSGIKKLEDLNGKVVSFNRKGSSTQTWLEQWAPLLGLKPSKIVNVGPGQGNRLLADGRIDAQFSSGTVPHARTMELEANHKIFVIGFGKENVEKITQKFPEVSPYLIKAGTYKSLDHDEYSTADALMMIVHKDIPDDLVYDVTKATFDKKDDLVKGNSRFKLVKIENIFQSTIPLHPGAVRFYKEKGIKLPDKLIP